MFVGAIASLLCRPDFKKKICIGSGIFIGLYFLFFKLLDMAFSGYAEKYWTMEAISEMIVPGIPIEEYFFALTFGLM